MLYFYQAFLNKSLPGYSLKAVCISICILFLSSLANVQAQSATNNNIDSVRSLNSFQNSILTYKITEAKSKTWGYQIYSNRTLIIDQTVVPCIQGDKGFKNKESAKKVATFVIRKIRNGIIPPTITLKELQELKVL